MSRSDWPAQSLGFGAFYFSYYSFVGVFPTFVSLFLAAKGLTVVEIGILMALMQAMRIVGPLLWGTVADATGKRARILQLTCIAALVCLLGFFFGSGFWWFALVMVSVNFFTSAQGPLSDALILGEMKGRMDRYGHIRLWGSVGYVVMTAASGFFLESFGILSMPWVSVFILAGVFVIAMRLYQSPDAQTEQVKVSIWPVLKRPEVLLFFASCTFMLGAHAALYSFYSLYLSTYGYGSTMIGSMWALGATAEIVFFIFQGPVVQKTGVKGLLLFSIAAAAVRFALIGVGAESFAVLIFAQLLHAATFGCHHIASILTVQRWFTGSLLARGQALFVSVSYGFGCTGAAFVLTWVWDTFSPQAVYACATGLSVVSLLLAAASIFLEKRLRDAPGAPVT